MQRPFNPQIVSQNALIIFIKRNEEKKRKTRAKIMQISSPFSSVYLPIAVGKEPVVFVPGGEVPMAIAHLRNRGSRPLLRVVVLPPLPPQHGVLGRRGRHDLGRLSLAVVRPRAGAARNGRLGRDWHPKVNFGTLLSTQRDR